MRAMTAVAVPLPAESSPRQPLGLFGRALTLGLVAALSSWFSIQMTRFDGGVAAFWVANGLLTGMLLLSPRATWRWWFVAAAIGQVVARLAHGSSLLVTVTIVAINLLESGIVAVWVRRQSASLATRSLGRTARDAMFATFFACAVSASLATFVLSQTVISTPPGVTWFSWYAAHVLGMVIVATLTVCTLQPQVGLLGRAGHRVDFVLSSVLLAATCFLVFWQERYPLLFLTYLPLMFMVWRHGLSGMMVGVVLVAGFSGVSAAQGHGPFGLIEGASALARMLFWQLYVASGCLLAYSTALSMARRRKLERDLQRSETRYRDLAEEAQRLARFDSLTGLANRRRFDEELSHAVARAGRNGSALMLLTLDLDHFKRVNDTLGHAAGDAELEEFARRIRDGVFDVDLVARLGGDEFAVLVEYTATEEVGARIAEHLLREMRPSFELEGMALPVQASIGIGLHYPVRSGEKLKALADEALYVSKGRGRGTWALCKG
jgi:diguanylate cyclase (GGDEF)-like protein